MAAPQIGIPPDTLRQFCEKHGITKFALFGSAIRDDFRPDSDVDVLVEFTPDETPDLLAFMGIQFELTELLGRDVDMHTFARVTRSRNHIRRRHVLENHEVLYEAG